MRKWTAAVVCLLMAFPLLARAQEKVGGGLKKRVAVMVFDNKTGHGGWELGTGMSDKLASALVKSGRFIVIEREQLANIMKEQALGMSGAVTQGTAASVGRLAGVELMVTGSVNVFGEKESKVGGSVGNRLGGMLGGMRGAGVDTKTAEVGCSIRLVNTSTGEILTAEDITEDASKKGLDLSHNEFAFSNDTYFDNTLAGKAMTKVIKKSVESISSAMDKLPWTGRILKNNGDGTVLIRPGEDGGVKVGDSYVIYSLGEKITDPETGEELGQTETKGGTVTVTAVQPKFATARVSGNGGRVGDAVRLK
jgi:curli biogenesis system outer membrane secretion channel CsgG